MELTVLGSGSSVQFENRASASFLLETSGKKIILDAGFCLLDRLERAGVRADEIDAVYISHKHPDHFFGLLHMLFALKHSFYSPKEEIFLFGFKGLGDWLDSFRKILGHWIEPDSKLIICEDVSGEFAGISWRLFDTVHSPESTGIVVESESRKLVYTGDTEYFEGLSDIARRADLLIAECGKGNGMSTKGHMSLDEVKKIAESSDISRILLTHIYPETDITQKKWRHLSTCFMRSDDLHKISL